MHLLGPVNRRLFWLGGLSPGSLSLPLVCWLGKRSVHLTQWQHWPLEPPFSTCSSQRPRFVGCCQYCRRDVPAFFVGGLVSAFSGLKGTIFSPLASSPTSSHFHPLHNGPLRTSSLLPFGGFWGGGESKCFVFFRNSSSDLQQEI